MTTQHAATRPDLTAYEEAMLRQINRRTAGWMPMPRGQLEQAASLGLSDKGLVRIQASVVEITPEGKETIVRMAPSICHDCTMLVLCTRGSGWREPIDTSDRTRCAHEPSHFVSVTRLRKIAPCSNCGERCGSQLKNMHSDEPHALCHGCQAEGTP